MTLIILRTIRDDDSAVAMILIAIDLSIAFSLAITCGMVCYAVEGGLQSLSANAMFLFGAFVDALSGKTPEGITELLFVSTTLPPTCGFMLLLVFALLAKVVVSTFHLGTQHLLELSVEGELGDTKVFTLFGTLFSIITVIAKAAHFLSKVSKHRHAIL